MNIEALVNEAIRRFENRTEFRHWVDELPVEDQEKLVAIMHIGREDGAVEPSDYAEHLVTLARNRNEDDSNGRYLSGKKPLTDYLRTGLNLLLED